MLNYGTTVVYGNFGSGKTYSTFLKMYEEKKRKNSYIISNVPYSIVDLAFHTEKELEKVIELLENYIAITNKDIQNYFTNQFDYRDIVVIIDEAHLYFDSRNYNVKGGNMERLTRVLTQCRKRNIKFYVITQRLTNIDIRIRRLTDYIEEYDRTVIFSPNFLMWVTRKIYENKGDIADIEADSTMKISNSEYDRSLKSEWLLMSEFYSPLTTRLKPFAKMGKEYKRLKLEEYNTLFVVGLPDGLFTYTINNFLVDIMKDNDPYKNYIEDKVLLSFNEIEHEPEKNIIENQDNSNLSTIQQKKLLLSKNK